MSRIKSNPAETREALLEAAECVFYEQGVAQTTLAQIAAAAGMTRGAIYWHFADKAALFEAMQERGRLPQEIAAALMEASASNDPLRHLGDVTIEALRHLAADKRSQRVCAIMLLRCEFVGEMAGVLERMRTADKQMHEAVHAAFEDLAQRDLLSPRWTPETATHAHLASIGGLIKHWLGTDKRFDLLQVGEPLVRCLFADFGRMKPA